MEKGKRDRRGEERRGRKSRRKRRAKEWITRRGEGDIEEEEVEEEDGVVRR